MRVIDLVCKIDSVYEVHLACVNLKSEHLESTMASLRSGLGRILAGWIDSGLMLRGPDLQDICSYGHGAKAKTSRPWITHAFEAEARQIPFAHPQAWASKGRGNRFRA